MDLKEHINTLAYKAGKSDDSADSLRFSQAALNLVHVAEKEIFLPKASDNYRTVGENDYRNVGGVSLDRG